MSAPNSILYDADEFGKFFSEYKKHFTNIAYSYIHDMDVAKDIVVDSFIYLWERRGELASDANIKGYVYCCVRSKCLSHLRGKITRIKAADEMSKAALWKLQSSLNSLNNDEITKKLFHAEMVVILQKELSKMPKRTREIFQASRDEGLTYQQIAEKYGISVRSVTTEIQSALHILRHAFRDFLVVFILFTASMRHFDPQENSHATRNRASGFEFNPQGRDQS